MARLEFDRLRAAALAQIRERGGAGDGVYALPFIRPQAQATALALASIQLKLDGVHRKQKMGSIQFEWWKEQLRHALAPDGDGHTRVQEPSARLLSLAVDRDRPKLSAYHLTRFVGAHQSLYARGHVLGSLQDLADWSAGTEGSILYLLLQATATDERAIAHAVPFEHKGHEHRPRDSSSASARAPVSALDLDHGASHLAVTLAIARLLRSIPANAALRRNLIPAEVSARFGLTDEELFRRGPHATGLAEAVATLVGVAKAELATSRGCFELTQQIPAERIGVFLTAVVAENWLKKLEAVDFDVFERSIQGRDWTAPFKVWRANWRRSF